MAHVRRSPWLRCAACRPALDVATLPPALRFGGSTTERGEPRRRVDAQRGRRRRFERLLLRLHDVRQRRIARLVETQVGRDDRRQIEHDRLETAVDFALDRGACRRRSRPSTRTWPAANRAAPPASGRSGCCRRRCLLAEDHELRLFLVEERLQQLGDSERLQLGVGLRPGSRDRRRARAHVRSVSWQAATPHGNGDDFGGDALLLEPHRLFDRDLVRTD